MLFYQTVKCFEIIFSMVEQIEWDWYTIMLFRVWGKHFLSFIICSKSLYISSKVLYIQTDVGMTNNVDFYNYLYQWTEQSICKQNDDEDDDDVDAWMLPM